MNPKPTRPPWMLNGDLIQPEGDYGAEPIARVNLDHPDWYGNAYAMVSAPELLAACREMRDLISGISDHIDDLCCTGFAASQVKILEDAIAKATPPAEVPDQE